MGNTFILKKAEAPLLPLAIAGDLKEIKKMIGEHIATAGLNSKEALYCYVDQGDDAGNTALIGAVFSGHLEIAKFLIEDCNADITVQNKIGCSAFWIACGYGHNHIVEYLIERIEASETLDLVKLCSCGNSSGDSPFLAAASKGHCDVINLLSRSLKNNLREVLTNTNAAGDTPLGVAVSMGHDDASTLLIQIEENLMGHDADNRPVNIKNTKGLTPLLVACERNFANIVKELRARGADMSKTDVNGRSSLAVASFCGCMDVTEVLLSDDDTKDLLLNGIDSNGCTPLWLAARTGNLKMVKCLIEAGADPNISDDTGLTPEAVSGKFNKNDVADFFAQ